MWYPIVCMCLSGDASSARAVKNWRWNSKRKGTDGLKNRQQRSVANTSPARSASAIALSLKKIRSHQGKSHEHGNCITKRLRRSILLEDKIPAREPLAVYLLADA